MGTWFRCSLRKGPLRREKRALAKLHSIPTHELRADFQSHNPFTIKCKCNKCEVVLKDLSSDLDATIYSLGDVSWLLNISEVSVCNAWKISTVAVKV